MSLPAILILAAGSSSRLGESKQLLSLHGASLLRHIAEVALSINNKCVMVVLGANEDIMKKELGNLPVECVINKEWESGMGASISCGIGELNRIEPDTERVIIMVCDQPYVSAQVLQELVRKQEETGKDIVACAYAGTVGVPALFTKNIFASLRNLKGNEGAKKIMLSHQDSLATIQFEKGSVDIDTKEDWDRFGKSLL